MALRLTRSSWATSSTCRSSGSESKPGRLVRWAMGWSCRWIELEERRGVVRHAAGLGWLDARTREGGRDEPSGHRCGSKLICARRPRSRTAGSKRRETVHVKKTAPAVPTHGHEPTPRNAEFDIAGGPRLCKCVSRSPEKSREGVPMHRQDVEADGSPIAE